VRTELLALLLLVACSPGRRAGRCALGEARRVARHAVAGFDAIALTASARGALALFSDATGSFARPLRGESAEQRVTERCAGGVAALADSASVWLACARPSAELSPLSDQGLWLYELDAQLRTRSALRLGDVARDGRGVALAATPQELFVAWGDGKLGAPSVQLARMARPYAGAVTPRTLSAPSANGRQPTLLWLAPHLYAAWTESELLPGGESHRIMVARDAEPARALQRVHWPDAAPQLARDGDTLVISFRELPSAGGRAELYVGRLSRQLAWLDRPHRLGRANGEGGPVLGLCAGARAAVAPLDHAGELYVAFHGLSRELRPIEANHQYYASGREFVLAAAACDGDALLALLAERTQPVRPDAELLSIAFRCEP
jgi:hypothetical protein